MSLINNSGSYWLTYAHLYVYKYAVGIDVQKSDMKIVQIKTLCPLIRTYQYLCAYLLCPVGYSHCPVVKNMHAIADMCICLYV